MNGVLYFFAHFQIKFFKVRVTSKNKLSLLEICVDAIIFEGIFMKRLFLILFMFSITNTIIISNVIKIPSNYKTIQEGLFNAEEGDTVLVSDGIYGEQIKFFGKNIFLTSENGAEVTIIDGSFLTEQDSSSLVYIYLGEDNQTIINGFTFRFGKGTYIDQYRQRQGGAIHCSASSFTLKNCTLIDNSGFEGGAIYYNSSKSRIDNCVFRSNKAGYGGGAIYAYFSDISVNNCRFIENISERFGGSFMGQFSELNSTNTIMYKNKAVNGGAIYSDIINIDFCTIVSNVAELGAGGGIFCEEGLIQNSILYFNNSTSNNNQIYPDNSSLIIEYCDIENGWSGEGNINQNPLFKNVVLEDFSLENNSPCIDSANPNSQLDPDGTIADIGAIYHNQKGNSSVFPLVLDFNEVNIGSKQTKVLTITNIFDTALTVTKIELNSDVFFTEIITPFTLLVEESINISIVFTPIKVEEYIDSMKITTNYSNENIKLKGSGINEYSGNVHGVWEKSSSPIIVTDNIIVPENDALEIESGVTVKIMGGKKITIYGKLYASGTVEDSIHFINYERTKKWWGLQFINSNNSSLLEYCVIEGANSDDNIANNRNAEENGGGIYCLNSNLIINNSKISKNRAAPVWSMSDGFGGGIYSKNSQLTIYNCEISNNIMSHGGGGIYSENSELILNNSIIKNNYAEEFAIYGNSSGAGIYIGSGIVKIINNSILNNYNYGYQNPGGGITISNCNKYLIEDNSIANNGADIGGGLFVNNSSGNIDYNNIHFNIASDGGGIYIQNSTATIQKNNITNNTAYMEGGGVYIYSDNVNIINNTIAYNIVECDNCLNGGGVSIYGNSQNNSILNSIIFGNKTNSNLDVSGQIDISYSLLGESVGGEGNINEDPLFEVSFLLKKNSPCIDKGSPIDIFNDIEDTNNIGFPLFPSEGSLRNDMGSSGGRIVADSLITSSNIEDDEIPFVFSLSQNYPNPFNPTTMVSYTLPTDSKVKIEITNILGQRVGVLVNKNKSAGYYEVTWNASNLSSGIYLISIRADGLDSKRCFVQVRKALLLK